MSDAFHLSPTIPPKARNWRNDPRIYRWCRQHSPISEEAHRRWLQRIEDDPSIKMFGIYLGGIPLGVCGLTSIDHVNQKAEFSLYIEPDKMGNGYGASALRLLIAYGFNSLNLNRIWGEVFDGNPAMALFEMVGFKKEGVLRQSYFREGKFIDSTIVSILRGEQ